VRRLSYIQVVVGSLPTSCTVVEAKVVEALGCGPRDSEFESRLPPHLAGIAQWQSGSFIRLRPWFDSTYRYLKVPKPIFEIHPTGADRHAWLIMETRNGVNILAFAPISLLLPTLSHASPARRRYP
jgi:hypothetical protein